MKQLCGAITISVVLTLIAVLSRPLLPIDETRYVGVAWDAYHSGDYLVSHKNGDIYAHKPPLLFWLINAAWSVFGVSDFAARLVAPLAGILCLPLVRWMAAKLWPTDLQTANYAPLVMATLAPWMLFAPLTMFDTLLTLSTLVALVGLLRAVDGHVVSGWSIAGIGIGLGILTKGPVILVHVLPAMLLAPWWLAPAVQAPDAELNQAAASRVLNRSRWFRWYSGLAAAIAIGATIGLAWAIPSALAGGEAYANELLFGQTTGRVVQSFSHRHHALWYLPLLPLCLLPWISLGSVWRGFRRLRFDSGLRFLISWIGGSLLILSAVSGKQIHYLIPLFPAFAVLLGKALSQAPQTIRPRDTVIIVSGTAALACLPLALNHLPKLQQLGLANIIPDYFVPLLLLNAASLAVLCRQTLRRAVWGLSALSSATIALIILGGSASFWHGFEVDPLANYVRAADQPVLWYGEYHAQLNFAGRLHPIDAVETDVELNDWVDQHPSGLIVMRLTSDDPTWKQFVFASQDQKVESPSLDRELYLRNILADKAEFARLAQLPQVKSIFWIRQGLIKKPYVALQLQNASTVEQTAAAKHDARR